MQIGNAGCQCDLATMLVPHCLQGSQKSVFSWLGICNNVFRIHCADVSLSCVYDGPGQAIGSYRRYFLQPRAMNVRKACIGVQLLNT
jgi:hypothetical protein